MSGIDGFTAGALLNAIGTSSTDTERNQAHDLFKEIKSDPENGPTPEQAEAVTALIGKRVGVAGYIAKVLRLNTATRGFYPGGRYPCIVEILDADREDRKTAIGSVFEYGLEQIELLKDEDYGTEPVEQCPIGILRENLEIVDKKLDSINRGNPNDYDYDELQEEKFDILTELEELE